MAKPSRRRESIHINAIYAHHPEFAGSEYHRWGGDPAGGESPEGGDPAGGESLEGGDPAGGESLEGGDIVVIGNGCVLVGFGERTRPAAIER